MAHPIQSAIPPNACSVVLLSGGLDSVTTLAMAADAGQRIYALSFNYGQRHKAELACATRQAARFGAVAHEVIDLAHLGRLLAPASALLGASALAVPKDRDVDAAHDIPSTYVPGRNLLFLSYAVAWAEVVGAASIWIGVNALDYSGYPDCRPAFIESFARTANLATRVGAQGQSALSLNTPLVQWRKHEIITHGVALGVDYGDTVSCYDPRIGTDGTVLACGRCDSCLLRRRGFELANVPDPTVYLPARDIR